VLSACPYCGELGTQRAGALLGITAHGTAELADTESSIRYSSVRAPFTCWLIQFWSTSAICSLFNSAAIV